LKHNLLIIVETIVDLEKNIIIIMRLFFYSWLNNLL